MEEVNMKYMMYFQGRRATTPTFCCTLKGPTNLGENFLDLVIFNLRFFVLKSTGSPTSKETSRRALSAKRFWRSCAICKWSLASLVVTVIFFRNDATAGRLVVPVSLWLLRFPRRRFPIVNGSRGCWPLFKKKGVYLVLALIALLQAYSAKGKYWSQSSCLEEI